MVQCHALLSPALLSEPKVLWFNLNPFKIIFFLSYASETESMHLFVDLGSYFRMLYLLVVLPANKCTFPTVTDIG